MARVVIDLPQSFDFATDLEVRIQHINRGNHLGNDSIVSFLNEARVRYMNEQINTLRDDEIWMINADLAIAYKSESFYGDVIKVEVTASNYHSCGFDLIFRLTETGDGRDVAHAKMAMLLMNSKTKELVRPEQGVQAFLKDVIKV